jgi:hypothetical protein
MPKRRPTDIEGGCNIPAPRCLLYGGLPRAHVCRAWESSVDSKDITPFRMSKPFEQHMPDVLDSIATDPGGLYQVTYRVGPIMVSAQIWVDEAWGQMPNTELTDYDREFLKQVRVLADQTPGHAAI